MNDRDHLEAVRVEAACVELRDEELAEVSGGSPLTPSIPIPPPLLALLGGLFGP
jgi:hypothetical protein